MFWKRVIGLDKFKLIVISLATLSCFNALPAEAATLNVPSSQYPTIQSAIDAAKLGDTIVVEAGRTYTENLILKYKSTGSGWITIQSSKLNLLPAEGNRVSPADAVNMPKLISNDPGTPVINTQSGANPTHHYKLIGLEVTRRDVAGTAYALINLGTSGSQQDNLAEVPRHFVIDRCYIHGVDGRATRRGLFIDSGDTEVTSSYFSKFFDVADTQAILSINSPGNQVITNNYLEATGENMLYGGGDPSIPNVVPTNVRIEYNHFFKPLSWKGNEPGTVKNLLELKIGKDFIIRNNIFENNWAHGQGGNAVLFTVRNQDGTAPWSTIQDILFEYNWIKNADGAFGILTRDDEPGHTSQVMKNLIIRNNLYTGSVAGRFLTNTFSGSTNNPASQIVFDHNTFIHKDSSGWNSFLWFSSGNSFSGLTVTNNIQTGSSGGGLGWIHKNDPDASGTDCLNAVAPNTWTFNKNVTHNGLAPYPSGAIRITGPSAVGFENWNNGDYRLKSNSQFYRAGTDGKDIGADVNGLNERTACVVSGKQSDCGSVTVPSSALFDFDGDGKADISVFRPTDSVWYVQRSSGGDSSVKWGLPTDTISPADFDGDGKTDIAVFRATESRWYILRSSDSSLSVAYFGTVGDIPVQADYDGDGKADIALWRPSNGAWYSLNSSNGGYSEIRFGMLGDRPAVGDYDGDGRSDLAIYRPSTGQWYIQQSTAGFSVLNFGVASDIVTPADFDGDGKTDIAVFRPSTGVWYLLGSANGRMTAFHFGMSGDIPSAADFDGDGRADIAVFRPSTGTWYAQNSTAGFVAQRYGLNGDIPLPSVRAL